MEDKVKEYEKNFSNIHLQPAVRPDEVLKYLTGCDIGIQVAKNCCLSYFYSLPNKFFEYILSGLPVVVNDWPEMGNFVDENECGWKVAESEKAVINLIESISREDIKAKRNNVLKCKDSLGWHKEKEKLLRIYSELIKNC